MKKTIDGVEYKVIKCKKYRDILDCSIDFFECIYCEHQTWYMKWASRKLIKKKPKKRKKNMNKRKFRKETIELSKKRLKQDEEFMTIRKNELYYIAKRVDHEIGKYPLHVLKTLIKDIIKEIKEEKEEE